MKKILILGAGVYQVPLIQAANARGLETHVVSPKGRYPGFDVCDKAVNLDTRDVDSILAYCKENGISGITTTGTDVAMKAIGHAVTHGGYRGPDLSSAICSTNKVEMKRKLYEHEIPSARYIVVESEEELVSSIETFKYPVMVKAVDTSGSRGITKVEDKNSLVKAFNDAKQVSKDDRIIVEEFLEGTEFGAQIVVIGDSVVDVVIHGDVVTSPPISVPIGHYLPYDLDRVLCDKVRQLSIDTVRALGIQDAVCNLDLMEVNGQPFVIEIGARMGATCLPENIGLYNGVDYYNLLLDIALGFDIHYQVQKNKLANASRLLVSQETGIFERFDLANVEKEGYSVEVKLDVEPGDKINRFVNGTHRYGHIVVAGPYLSECNALIEQILNESRLAFRQ